MKRGVWHVARECDGIAEAGGLKDVVAGLATALARTGVPVRVILPRYGFLDIAALGARELPYRFRLQLPSRSERSERVQEEISVHHLEREGVEFYLLDSPRTRSKRGVYTYVAADEAEDEQKRRGTGHWDSHHLNVILQRGALELALVETPPAVFHCHDGHAALLPVLLREDPRYATALAGSRALLTIHNAGWGYHQEIYDLTFAEQLTGLPRRVLEAGVLNEAVDPLLLGARYAVVNTVSEGYAEEVASGGLDGLTGGLGSAYARAGIRLLGITNGVDPTPFDPRDRRATGLPQRFDPSRDDLRGKARCREELQRMLAQLARPRAASARKGAAAAGAAAGAGGTAGAGAAARAGGTAGAAGAAAPLAGLAYFGGLDPSPRAALYTFVGRLTAQKGVDVLVGALRELFRQRAPLRVLVLGQGESALEERLLRLSREVPSAGRLGVLLGYNPQAAKYLFAAGDFFLVPSQYEPCGLTDLYAQLLGTLPVVHRVGGLVKVVHGRTGYTYREHSASALAGAIAESLEDYERNQQLLKEMRREAFLTVFRRYTWERVLANRYLPLYENESLWTELPS